MTSWNIIELNILVFLGFFLNDEDEKHFDTDILNKINSSGILPHQLALKPNTPLIIIQNLNLKRKICNGTQCIIKNITSHIIQAKHLETGEDIFNPEILTIYSETEFPATL